MSLDRFLQPFRDPAHLAHLHANSASRRSPLVTDTTAQREKYHRNKRHGVKGSRAGTQRGAGGCGVELMFERSLKGCRPGAGGRQEKAQLCRGR